VRERGRLRRLRVGVCREERLTVLDACAMRTSRSPTLASISRMMNSRCRIRYIVMSMSFGCVRCAAGRPPLRYMRHQEALDMEKRSSQVPVVRRLTDRVDRDRVERVPNRARMHRFDDAAWASMTR
jgi:hypothetical protein